MVCEVVGGMDQFDEKVLQQSSPESTFSHCHIFAREGARHADRLAFDVGHLDRRATENLDRRPDVESAVPGPIGPRADCDRLGVVDPSVYRQISRQSDRICDVIAHGAHLSVYRAQGGKMILRDPGEFQQLGAPEAMGQIPIVGQHERKRAT